MGVFKQNKLTRQVFEIEKKTLLLLLNWAKQAIFTFSLVAVHKLYVTQREAYFVSHNGVAIAY
jgi:hypothetical protein